MHKSKVANAKHIPSSKIDKDTNESIMVICGSVDSGKTSLLAILSNPIMRQDPEANLNKCLDDGNGSARKLIMRFPHELNSGRTSSISYTPILFDMTYWPHLNENSIIMTTDLCGHEQYLKTTITGICSSYCEFALICVDRIRDKINPMTKEHIKLLMSLSIPFAIVLTKIDIQTEAEIKNTIKVLMKNMRGKKPFIAKNDKDIEAINIDSKWVPFFLVSCKTGYGILRLMKFISNIRSHNDAFECPLFSIDSIFNVAGHGVVVSGNSGINICVGEKLIIGPFLSNTFADVTVRSIHDNYKNNINELIAGKRGCLCIKFSQKDSALRHKINAGMVLSKAANSAQLSNVADSVQLSNKFLAEIKVFTGHHTSIKTGFVAMCNIGNIRASAKFKLIDADIGRSGDSLMIELEFLRTICPIIGSVFVFRDGISIGHGIIVKALTM